MHLFESKDSTIVFFSELQDYDDLEIIAQRFVVELNAKIIKKLNGPYSRVWELEIGNEKFQLIADESYGSSLKALSESSRKKIKELMPIFVNFIQ